MKKVKWGAVVLVVWGGTLGAQPRAPVECLTPLAALPCAEAGDLQAVCAAMRRVPADDAAAQIAAMAHVAAQPATQRIVARVAQQCRRGGRTLECGIGLLLAGTPGDGISRLLAAYVAERGTAAASAGVYWGFLLAWPMLDDVQQRDWADDLAGRLLAPHVPKAATGPAALGPEWLQPIVRGLYCAAAMKPQKTERTTKTTADVTAGSQKNK